MMMLIQRSSIYFYSRFHILINKKGCEPVSIRFMYITLPLSAPYWFTSVSSWLIWVYCTTILRTVVFYNPVMGDGLHRDTYHLAILLRLHAKSLCDRNVVFIGFNKKTKCCAFSRLHVNIFCESPPTIV